MRYDDCDWLPPHMKRNVLKLLPTLNNVLFYSILILAVAAALPPAATDAIDFRDAPEAYNKQRHLT